MSDDPDVKTRVELLLRRSAARVKSGDAEGALDDAEEAADLRPDDDAALLRRGYDCTTRTLLYEPCSCVTRLSRSLCTSVHHRETENDACLYVCMCVCVCVCLRV